jgi:hypothetical protein
MARDDAGLDSHCNSLIVVLDDAPLERHRGHPAYEALRRTGIPLDVLVSTGFLFRGSPSAKGFAFGRRLAEWQLLHSIANDRAVC